VRYVSEDGRRMIDDDPPLCVAAAYEVDPTGTEPGRVDYQHVGIFDNEKKALKWLREGSPKPIKIRIIRTR
jgi:hypothetical protein